MYENVLEVFMLMFVDVMNVDIEIDFKNKLVVVIIVDDDSASLFGV